MTDLTLQNVLASPKDYLPAIFLFNLALAVIPLSVGYSRGMRPQAHLGALLTVLFSWVGLILAFSMFYAEGRRRGEDGCQPFAAGDVLDRERQRPRYCIQCGLLNPPSATQCDCGTPLVAIQREQPASATIGRGDAADSGDLDQRLRQLKSLHEQGLITDQQFETKQRAILDAL